MGNGHRLWLSRLSGRFIVFDGPDGSGKSTQCHKFARFVTAGGVTVCPVREPGGTPIGEQIRTVLLDTANHAMDLRCEMLLYMASRAQLIQEKIQPALAADQLVLADRFISSTLAYQGAAGGLDQADIHRVGRIALGSCWPDLFVIFDVDGQTASSRLAGGVKTNRYTQSHEPTLFSDRMERKGATYQQAVRQGYLDQANADPDRYLVIDASGGADQTFDRLLNAIQAKTVAWSSLPHQHPQREDQSSSPTRPLADD